VKSTCPMFKCHALRRFQWLAWLNCYWSTDWPYEYSLSHELLTLNVHIFWILFNGTQNSLSYIILFLQICLEKLFICYSCVWVVTYFESYLEQVMALTESVCRPEGLQTIFTNMSTLMQHTFSFTNNHNLLGTNQRSGSRVQVDSMHPNTNFTCGHSERKEMCLMILVYWHFPGSLSSYIWMLSCPLCL